MTNSHKININTKKISKKARNNSRLYKKKFRTFSKTIDILYTVGLQINLVLFVNNCYND